MEIKIAVACHKDVPDFDMGRALFPVQAGALNASRDFGIARDDEREHISNKNPYYSELSVMYWLWKNINSEVKGLFHYRRFLNLLGTETQFCQFGEDFTKRFGLEEERIAALMKEYDVILPFFVPENIKDTTPSVYDYYAKAHYRNDMDVMLAVIAEKYPEMAPTAEMMLKEKKQSFCANVLIAKEKLFDAYAEWLFDVLFEVEKRIGGEVLARDSYQKRVYGFLSERCLGIYMMYMAKTAGIKIALAPALFWQTDERAFKKYQARCFKRKILTFFHLGRKEWIEVCPILKTLL